MEEGSCAASVTFIFWLTPSKDSQSFQCKSGRLTIQSSNFDWAFSSSKLDSELKLSEALWTSVVFTLTPLWAIVIIFRGIPWPKWRRTSLIVIATIASTSLLIVSALSLVSLPNVLCCSRPFCPGFHHPLSLPFWLPSPWLAIYFSFHTKLFRANAERGDGVFRLR